MLTGAWGQLVLLMFQTGSWSDIYESHDGPVDAAVHVLSQLFLMSIFFRKMFWCSELLTYLECAWKFVICLFLLTPHKHTPFHHSLCTREFNRRESVRWLILGGTCPVRVHFLRNCLTHAEGPAVIVANRVKLLPIDKFPDRTIKEIISYCTLSGCTASQCMVSYCIVLLRNVSYHIISYCTV